MKFHTRCYENYFTGVKSRNLQYLAALGVNLGIISIGMHYGWSSTALPLLTNGNYTFIITSKAGSWLTSMIAIGSIVGSVLALVCVPILGRRTNILLSILPLAISWFLIALARSEFYMFVGRFLSGVLDGVLFTVIPPYLTEISDSEIRGFIGTTCMVSLAFGILAINLLALMMSVVAIAYSAAAISLSMLLMVPFIPESPYFLLAKNDRSGAEKSLQKLKGKSEVSDDLSRMSTGLIEARKDGTKFSDLLCNSYYRKLLMIALGLNAVQHGSGYLAIQSYCKIIFEKSGYTISPSIASVIYFAVSFLASLVAPLVVDSAGRRPVILISSAVSCLALLGNGTYLFIRIRNNMNSSSYDFIQLIFIIIFAAAHGTGLHTIPILITNEIFLTNLRPFVLCLTNVNFGIVATMTILFFNAALENFGLYVAFWGCAGLLFFGTIFIAICMPETKKKTLENIQLEMKM